jgi:cell division protein FtsB
MARRSKRTPAADPPLDPAAEPAPEPQVAAATPAVTAAVGTLADLPVLGLNRRRVGLLLGALVAAWVIVLFARQVGDASSASARADELRASNTQLQRDVGGLERELQLIKRQAYIAQQARIYRLGPAREIPFALADGAPALDADAPGMPSVRLGAREDRPTPLDSWLDLLFGPGEDDAGG